MKGKSAKILSIVLSLCLLSQQLGFAQVALQLNLSRFLYQLAPVDRYRPLHLRYFSFDSKVNKFELLLDKGDLKKATNEELRSQGEELFKYFLVGLTLPNKTFWVNLRPDSKDRIIDPALEKTDVGKILLDADLQLKKDTARYTSPENPQGKEYWDRVYKKAAEIFGTENITIPTLTRPWIVPNEVIIRYNGSSAYIYKATLKVCLEQDYLKDSATYNFSDPRMKELNAYASQQVRELIIPLLNKEINQSKRYAQLRQVFYSLILAQWFKQECNNSNSPYCRMIDRYDINKLVSQESWSKDTYFNAYKKSFEQGEYNIKTPSFGASGQTIRTYFSGGLVLAAAGIVNKKVDSPAFGINASSPLQPRLDTDRIPVIVNADGRIELASNSTTPPTAKLATDSHLRNEVLEQIQDNRPEILKEMAANFHYVAPGLEEGRRLRIAELTLAYITYPKSGKPVFDEDLKVLSHLIDAFIQIGKSTLDNNIQGWDMQYTLPLKASAQELLNEAKRRGAILTEIGDALYSIDITSPAAFRARIAEQALNYMTVPGQKFDLIKPDSRFLLHRDELIESTRVAIGRWIPGWSETSASSPLEHDTIGRILDDRGPILAEISDRMLKITALKGTTPNMRQNAADQLLDNAVFPKHALVFTGLLAIFGEYKNTLTEITKAVLDERYPKWNESTSAPATASASSPVTVSPNDEIRAAVQAPYMYPFSRKLTIPYAVNNNVFRTKQGRDNARRYAQEVLKKIEESVLTVVFGKDFEGGKQVVKRGSADANLGWTDMLREKHPDGVKFLMKQVQLTQIGIPALMSGDFETYNRCLNEYAQTRSNTSKTWLSLLLRARKGEKGLPLWVYERLKVIQNNPSEYRNFLDLFDDIDHGRSPADYDLYAPGDIGKAIQAAAEYNKYAGYEAIGLFALGAGGAGTVNALSVATRPDKVSAREIAMDFLHFLESRYGMKVRHLVAEGQTPEAGAMDVNELEQLVTGRGSYAQGRHTLAFWTAAKADLDGVKFTGLDDWNQAPILQQKGLKLQEPAGLPWVLVNKNTMEIIPLEQATDTRGNVRPVYSEKDWVVAKSWELSFDWNNFFRVDRPILAAENLKLVNQKIQEHGFQGVFTELWSWARANNKKIFISAPARWLDTLGSSWDLKDFRIEGTPEGNVRLEILPSCNAIPSEYRLEIEISTIADSHVIEYAAPQYFEGVHRVNPNKLEYLERADQLPGDTESILFVKHPLPAQDARGIQMLKRKERDLPALFARLFGITGGIRFTCNKMSAVPRQGGMESSNIFTDSVAAIFNMLSGANFSVAEISHISLMAQINEANNITGNQGADAAWAGAGLHVYLGGMRDNTAPRNFAAAGVDQQGVAWKGIFHYRSFHPQWGVTSYRVPVAQQGIQLSDDQLKALSKAVQKLPEGTRHLFTRIGDGITFIILPAGQKDIVHYSIGRNHIAISVSLLDEARVNELALRLWQAIVAKQLVDELIDDAGLSGELNDLDLDTKARETTLVNVGGQQVTLLQVINNFSAVAEEMVNMRDSAMKDWNSMQHFLNTGSQQLDFICFNLTSRLRGNTSEGEFNQKYSHELTLAALRIYRTMVALRGTDLSAVNVPVRLTGISPIFAPVQDDIKTLMPGELPVGAVPQTASSPVVAMPAPRAVAVEIQSDAEGRMPVYPAELISALDSRRLSAYSLNKETGWKATPMGFSLFTPGNVGKVIPVDEQGRLSAGRLSQILTSFQKSGLTKSASIIEIVSLGGINNKIFFRKYGRTYQIFLDVRWLADSKQLETAINEVATSRPAASSPVKNVDATTINAMTNAMRKVLDGIGVGVGDKILKRVAQDLANRLADNPEYNDLVAFSKLLGNDGAAMLDPTEKNRLLEAAKTAYNGPVAVAAASSPIQFNRSTTIYSETINKALKTGKFLAVTPESWGGVPGEGEGDNFSFADRSSAFSGHGSLLLPMEGYDILSEIFVRLRLEEELGRDALIVFVEGLELDQIYFQVGSLQRHSQLRDDRIFLSAKLFEPQRKEQLERALAQALRAIKRTPAFMNASSPAEVHGQKIEQIKTAILGELLRGGSQRGITDQNLNDAALSLFGLYNSGRLNAGNIGTNANFPIPDSILTVLDANKLETIIRRALSDTPVSSPAKSDGVGGIDFRYINMMTQAQMFKAQADFRMPKLDSLKALNIAKERAELQKLIAAGIMPDKDRVIEFVSACHLRGEDADGAFLCIADYLKLQEESATDTDADFKVFLTLIDSGKIS